MSLTVVSVAGIFLGFLCLAIGFYMESMEEGSMAGAESFETLNFEILSKPSKRAKRSKVRVFKHRRKAA